MVHSIFFPCVCSSIRFLVDSIMTKPNPLCERRALCNYTCFIKCILALKIKSLLLPFTRSPDLSQGTSVFLCVASLVSVRNSHGPVTRIINTGNNTILHKHVLFSTSTTHIYKSIKSSTILHIVT